MSAMEPEVEQIVGSGVDAGASNRQIDDVDRSLLAALVDDGRMSLTDLADRVNISRSTVHARVQRLR